MDWDSEYTHYSSPQRPGPLAQSFASDALGALPNEIAAPDFDLFRDVLNRHYYPARVEPLDRSPFMRRPRLSAVRLKHMTIGYVRFGTPASVDPGDINGYHVNVPLRGEVISQCGDEEVLATPRTAAVFSPHRHTFLPYWGQDAAQLCVKFDRLQVERELAAMTGRPVSRPIDFRLAMPLDTAPGRRWLSQLSILIGYLEEGGNGSAAAAMHQELLQRSLISGLLLAHAHSYSDALMQDTPGSALPRSLRRVVAAIEAAPERPHTLTELADLAGLSARGLQYAFRGHLGTTPSQYVQQVRLDRIHEDLLDGNGSVSDIAYNWGFTNLGRLARAYRGRFGVFPSETLSDGGTGRGARPSGRMAETPRVRPRPRTR
ncbi:MULTISPECIES: AraC family transcriptional regulator [Streptomyces]|jgi:AraC-like DNA-binding protein|uniref:AraC family transcriptional regulator n=1 Tax=Streptomyces sp. 900129855 TaxID=3155129 RepID=A0ABV2ZUR8_9ACTN